MKQQAKENKKDQEENGNIVPTIYLPHAVIFVGDCCLAA
jgi:hypothetical protein